MIPETPARCRYLLLAGNERKNQPQVPSVNLSFVPRPRPRPLLKLISVLTCADGTSPAVSADVGITRLSAVRSLWD